MDLYRDLKHKVDSAGFTMKAVCEHAGVSTGTPSHWAAGRTFPNQQTYNKLIAALREMVTARDSSIKASGLK